LSQEGDKEMQFLHYIAAVQQHAHQAIYVVPGLGAPPSREPHFPAMPERKPAQKSIKTVIPAHGGIHAECPK
jgi:hypothetical protein